ncbi:TonB-dependent siderophore receptor [Opitutales bacterium]|nr:TonB-dependent siderophore receptor [Opitutales bacterium]
MKKLKSQRWARAMVAVALSSFHINAFADEKASGELDPLGVVGSKEELQKLSPGLKSSLELKEIPRSISVMSAEQIKAQGLKSIGDVIDYTPGVINSQGEGHRDAPVIRGVRTTQDLYRDGIRDDVQYYRPLYNVERVEVLRGPDALTSGFGGAYGMINRVTKEGLIGEDFTEISGSVDSFGEFGIQLDRNVQIDKNTAFRLNMFGEDLANHRDFYYGNSFGANPTLKYDLGNGSTVDLSYEYLNQERFIDRGIPTGVDGYPVQSLKDIVFGDPTENYSTHEAHILKAIYEHKLSESLKGRFTAAYSDHDKLYQNFYASAYDAAENTVTLDGYVDTTKRKTSTFQYELIGELETGNILHNWIAGLEYLDVSNDNDRFHADWSYSDAVTDVFSITRPISLIRGVGINSEGNTTVNNYRANQADETFADVKVLSFYINDEIALTDSLDLMLGARFDKMEVDVSGGGPVSDSDDTISPKVGLIYDVTDAISVYASYSETFTPKAKDQYAKLKSNADKTDPDTFENTEFGLRYDLPVGLSLSAAYFEVEKNAPTYVDAMTSTMSTSEISGFEVQLSGNLTSRWFISAGYTNLDAHASDGDRLKETPEDVFSIWNNFTVSDRLALNLGIINQGESYIKEGGTQKLPEYTRVDAGASYALSENTSIQLNIENLTDELYFPHAHGDHQASVGAPINAMLSITSKF